MYCKYGDVAPRAKICYPCRPWRVPVGSRELECLGRATMISVSGKVADTAHDLFRRWTAGIDFWCIEGSWRRCFLRFTSGSCFNGGGELLLSQVSDLASNHLSRMSQWPSHKQFETRLPVLLRRVLPGKNELSETSSVPPHKTQSGLGKYGASRAVERRVFFYGSFRHLKAKRALPELAEDVSRMSKSVKKFFHQSNLLDGTQKISSPTNAEANIDPLKPISSFHLESGQPFPKVQLGKRPLSSDLTKSPVKSKSSAYSQTLSVIEPVNKPLVVPSEREVGTSDRALSLSLQDALDAHSPRKYPDSRPPEPDVIHTWETSTKQLWIQRKWDISFVSMVAQHLGIQEKTSNFALKFPRSDLYLKITELWKKDQRQVEEVEEWCKSQLKDPAEGLRRTVTFHDQLRKCSLASNWQIQRFFWIENRALSLDQLKKVETAYGLSVDPSKIKEIPTLTPSFDADDELSLKIRSIIKKDVFTPKELQKRAELKKYLESRGNYHKWWKEDQLEMDSNSFGLDILTILKLGDALRFSFTLEKQDRTAMSLSSSFLQLVAIMRDDSKDLPWLESAERAWLYRNHPGFPQPLHSLGKLLKEMYVKSTEGDRQMMKAMNDLRSLIPDLKNADDLGHILAGYDGGFDPNIIAGITTKDGGNGGISNYERILEVQYPNLSEQQKSYIKNWLLFDKTWSQNAPSVLHSFIENSIV
ncbi:hypothetical protein O181_032933 [Austropuccinia psidii MF-1]|uniref:Uncharacterized protein n=1 Tax=Austropuccinia psidii MF-1 TaxID=1389203 RepID=A0A9Q3D0G5_9BASI|nr:hypothetical protein [Austropuccinia psidii MF-1]